MTKKIEDVMTKMPHTIGDDQSVASAKREMQHHGFRHLPVLHGGRCIGMISERDVTLLQGSDEAVLESLKVKDVCSLDVFAVSGSTPLAEVAKQLATKTIGSAVVLDDRERVIGIFTVTDACRVLAECCNS